MMNLKRLILTCIFLTSPTIKAGCGGSVPVEPEGPRTATVQFTHLYEKNDVLMAKLVKEHLPKMVSADVQTGLEYYTEEERVLLAAAAYSYELLKKRVFSQSDINNLSEYMKADGKRVIASLNTPELRIQLGIQIDKLLKYDPVGQKRNLAARYAASSKQDDSKDEKDNN